MSEKLTGWMGDYQVAWESNSPEDIGALWSEGARYRPEPWSEWVVGRDSIVAEWLARADEPGNHSFTWHPLVETDDVSIAQAVTDYPGNTTYSNLWVIRFDDEGRATEFTEWWMDQATKS